MGDRVRLQGRVLNVGGIMRPSGGRGIEEKVGGTEPLKLGGCLSALERLGEGA